MKESLGSTFLYNIIIVFIVIVFAILAATLTYYKAYKVNTKIITSIEKFEGYNNLSSIEINNTLTSIGYMYRDDYICPDEKNGATLFELEDTPESKLFRYCVYYYPEDGDDRHYSYGVMTYMIIDIPVVNMFLQIPIYTRSNRIFRFNG